MKLGNYAHISISVTTLHRSRSFYESLGFKKIWTGQDPNPWVLLSEGVVNIHLYESPFSSPAVQYFAKDTEERVRYFESLGMTFQRQRGKDNKLFQDVLYDPNDQAVVLIPYDDTEMPKPSGESHTKCGRFGELSVSTDDLAASLKFWERFDFKEIHRSATSYPWATITDGIMTIGLHQRKGFLKTALSFFASDMDTRVTQLRKEGIEFAHEIREPDGRLINAILESPDNQMFFLFSERT